MNATGPYWWLINIGSRNGLVPSGDKPLPEPVLTKSPTANGVTMPQWVNVNYLLHYPSFNGLHNKNDKVRYRILQKKYAR